MVRRLGLFGILALLAGVWGLGCFDVEEGTQVAEGPGAFSDLLRFVPDEGEFRERVTITDLSAIREHYGLERTGGTDGLLEMVLALEEDGLGLPTLGGMFGAEDSAQLPDALGNWEQGFGFGLAEFDRTLTAGFVPPRYLYAVGGQFDAAGVEETLAGCGECLPHEVAEHAGQRYLSWGEGQQLPQRGALPAFDVLGRGGVFAFTDDYLLRSNWTEDLTQMIDASQGSNSLAKEAAFAGVAEAADELGLFTLLLTDVTQDIAKAPGLIERWTGNDRFERAIDAWTPDSGEVLLRPYSVWGAGDGIDEAGTFTAVILAHASEEDAVENVGRLEERLATGSSVWRELPWSELFSRVEVSSDGAVLTAKLYGRSAVALLIEGFDPLLLHE